MRRVRVLAAGPLPPPWNGMSVTTAALFRGLPARGIELCLIDIADRRGLANVARLDVGNVALALWAGLRFIARLAVWWPAVVYVPIAQNVLGFLRDCLFLVPALVTRRRVVVHLHGCAFDDFYRSAPPWVKWLCRFTLGRSHTAIVLGSRAVACFEGLVPFDRIRVIPNGVPDDPFLSRRDGAERFGRGCAETRRLVLFLGSLVPGKGVLQVLEAVPRLLDIEGLEFVFAGGFRSEQVKASALRLVRSAGAEARVKFVGEVSPVEAERLLRQSRVLVLPALHKEGQPLVILEALRAGTPVVATPSGCIPDTITHGRDGLLVPAGDVRALADAIRRLATDEHLWTGMSAAARRTYEERYKLDRWLDDMAEVLEAAALPERRGV